jgi:hypothetical protein
VDLRFLNNLKINQNLGLTIYNVFLSHKKWDWWLKLKSKHKLCLITYIDWRFKQETVGLKVNIKQNLGLSNSSFGLSKTHLGWTLNIKQKFNLLIKDKSSTRKQINSIIKMWVKPGKTTGDALEYPWSNLSSNGTRPRPFYSARMAYTSLSIYIYRDRQIRLDQIRADRIDYR